MLKRTLTKSSIFTTVINEQFRLSRQLREGHQERYFRGLHQQDRELVLAIVYDDDDGKERENKAFKMLAESTKLVKLLWEGDAQIGKKMRFVRIFQHYGPSLRELAGGEMGMDLETVYLVAYQLLTILEAIHCKDLLHLHLRPMAILADKDFDEERALYICSLKYCGRHGKLPDAYRPFKYSSVGLHLFENPTFRDDYESLYYLLIRLIDPSVLKVREALRGNKHKHRLEAKLALRTHPRTIAP